MSEDLKNKNPISKIAWWIISVTAASIIGFILTFYVFTPIEDRPKLKVIVNYEIEEAFGPAFPVDFDRIKIKITNIGEKTIIDPRVRIKLWGNSMDASKEYSYYDCDHDTDEICRYFCNIRLSSQDSSNKWVWDINWEGGYYEQLARDDFIGWRIRYLHPLDDFQIKLFSKHILNMKILVQILDDENKSIYDKMWELEKDPGNFKPEPFSNPGLYSACIAGYGTEGVEHTYEVTW